jgi:hypothetical protein
VSFTMPVDTKFSIRSAKSADRMIEELEAILEGETSY